VLAVLSCPCRGTMAPSTHQVRTPHGAKAAEVYGIVGYLLSLMTFGPPARPRLPAAACAAGARVCPPGRCAAATCASAAAAAPAHGGSV
jgi:hypothetical protein